MRPLVRGSASSTFFRPPPIARMRLYPASTNFPRPNSATALVMVVRDIPDNFDNRLIPPRPWSNALSATYNRA
jgi:hypothetical protein